MSFAPQRFRGFTRKQLLICLALSLVLVFAFAFNFKSSPKPNHKVTNQGHKEDENHEEDHDKMVVDEFPWKKEMLKFRKVCKGWREGILLSFI